MSISVGRYILRSFPRNFCLESKGGELKVVAWSVGLGCGVILLKTVKNERF